MNGVTGATIFTKTSINNNEHYGAAVDGGFDMNADGVRDIIVGTDPSAGVGCRVEVANGATGAFIRQVSGTAGSRFGAAVAIAGDLNLDGTVEFTVGAPLDSAGGASAGKVFVYNGKTGVLLWTKTGTAGAELGTSVANAGDLNNDGVPEFMAGAPYDNGGGANFGRIYIMSGATGSTLTTLNGFQSGGEFGFAIVGNTDINNDGKVDYIVGSPVEGSIIPANADGVARVFDGATNSIIYKIGGALQNGSRNGGAVTRTGDMDLDGFADFAISAPEFSTSTGRVRVFSGAAGTSIYTITGAAPSEQFGAAIRGNINLNSDGVNDLLVSSPTADTPLFNNIGEVRAFSGAFSNVNIFGTGTHGCFGGNHGIHTNRSPHINDPNFEIRYLTGYSGTNLGLTMVGDAPDADGINAFGASIDLILHLDVFACTELLAYDAYSQSDISYYFTPAPIPNDPGLVGKQYTVVGVFAWIGSFCTPSLNSLSSSPGMTLTIQ